LNMRSLCSCGGRSLNLNLNMSSWAIQKGIKSNLDHPKYRKNQLQSSDQMSWRFETISICRI
jgi:hypothetical protein